jgi:putative ABC transport system permease protein
MLLDFLLALRNLKKNKTLAFINAFGLSVGISACLVIFLIADFELSYNTFQPDGDRIFRVYTQYTVKGFARDYRGTYPAAVITLRDNVAGIEGTTHFQSWWTRSEINVGVSQPKVFEAGNNFIFAGPDFFNVFSVYQWLEGSPESSLSTPDKVVLTESRARMYFGQLPFHQLIGKEITYQDSLHFYVSGIVSDIKGNSDFTFSDFISYSTAEHLGRSVPFSFSDSHTLNNSSQLFIKVAEGIEMEQIVSQLPKHDLKETDGVVFHLKLQPLSDLHFNTTLGTFDVFARAGIKKSTLQILITLAVALLLVACINFVNLETAQASKFSKEIGVRKILGSSRGKLMGHFLMRSFILTFISVLLSVCLAWLALFYFKELIPIGVSVDLSSPNVLLFLLVCLVCVSVLAGVYPAFIISSYQPLRALKGDGYERASGAQYVRKSLTVFQFAFSQILIVATIVGGLQINYLLNKDLGFDTEAIITFRTPSTESQEKKLAMRNSLARTAGVEKISLQSQPPSGADGTNSLLLILDEEKEPVERWINAKYGDDQYLDLYDITLLAGRNFIEGDSGKGILINEAYLNKLGFTNPRDIVGHTVSGNTIIGVVKNFHTESLHTVIQPAVIVFNAQKLYSIGVKLNLSEDRSGKLNETLGKIENAWKEIYPNDPFEFSFIDDRIRNFYESEQRINKLAGVATGIAIVISCLGLFALSSFIAVERTKEIGIRKVLGASVNSILMLLSSQFLKLIVIAFIVSTPIAYYVTQEWLTDFAFKIDLSLWIFILSGALSITLAFITISFRTVKAAKADPVKSLRYE